MGSRRRSKTRGFLRKCQPSVCQGVPVATQTGAEGRSVRPKKKGNIKQTTAWAKQEHMKEKQLLQSSATCGGKRQWCLGSEEPKIPSHAWQNDVKASVDNTWQSSIPPHAVSMGCRASRNQRLTRKIFLRIVR